MHHLRHRTAPLSILVALALGVAACGSSTGSSSTSSQTPTNGGTLKLLGSSDVDHLDTASAYYTASYTLERAFTRQLFSYPASTDQTKAITPVPDLASELPTTANGGITADGKTYTIHLRHGVLWNTHPARAVTAADVVLGLKRLCNPVSPVGAPGYYTDTIVGMKAYCDGFAKVNGDAASIAAYIKGHDIRHGSSRDASRPRRPLPPYGTGSGSTDRFPNNTATSWTGCCTAISATRTTTPSR